MPQYLREVSLDTETTGGAIKDGDRAIDIGLVELVDGRRTGRSWQSYINPEGRKSHWGALRVHGIKDDFLTDKPLFKDVAGDMLKFIDGSPCLAHNARFDRDVVMAEFYTAGLQIPDIRFFDTITIAKSVITSGSMKLDNLIRVLGIETPDRKVHGALLDADILAMAVEELDRRFPNLLDKSVRRGRPIDALPKFLKSKVHGPDRDTDRQHRAEAARKDTPEPGKKPVAQNFEGMNEGVEDAIAALNATTGSLTAELACLMRTKGRDLFSNLTADNAADLARKKFASSDIQAALDTCEPAYVAGALRWMCRGLRPDRWAECFRVDIAVRLEKRVGMAESDSPAP